MAAPRQNRNKSRIAQASAEERLYEYAKGLRKFRKDRRVVLVQMSNLTRMFQDQRYRRAALRLFQPLMQEFEGLLVELYNGDILCGLHGASFADMDAVVLKLRIMFRDDANLKAQEDEDGEDDIFASWWEIEKDFDDFLEFAKATYDAARIAEMEETAANEQENSIGNKIVALSNKGSDLKGMDGLRGRFSNAMAKRSEGEIETEIKDKPDDGLASKFGQVRDVSGLSALSNRGKNNDAQSAPRMDASPQAQPAAGQRPSLKDSIRASLGGGSAQSKESTAEGAQSAAPAPAGPAAQAPQRQQPGQAASHTIQVRKTPEQDEEREILNAQVVGRQAQDQGEEEDRPPGIRRNIRYVEIKPPKKEIEIRPVSALDLEKIETAILGADLSPMVRREPIKLITKNGSPQTVFSDSMVPIPMIRERFLPLVDISADRWFMRHLRELVDRRTLVASLDFSDPGAMARGFRVSTDAIDSKEFEIFERNTRKLRRNQLILEFSFQDIVSNVAGYLRAQDILQARGYRICIGDMDPYMFTLLNRTVIHSDFEKVRWTEDFQENSTPEWQDVFKNMIKEVGSERVILVACKDEDALNAGTELGVKLFHGSYIEKL